MTVVEFLSDGEAESVKRGVHRVMQVGAGACFAYNLAAWIVRRKKHLLVGALIYGALVVIETAHVRSHSADL